MGPIFQIVFNLFISIASACLRIILWLFGVCWQVLQWALKSLLGMFGFVCGAAINRQKQHSVGKLKDTIDQSYLDNHILFEKTNQIVALLPQDADLTDRKKIEEQQRYCSEKEQILKSASEDIATDIASGNVNNLQIKYGKVIQEIRQLHYSLSIDQLTTLSQKYIGDTYFVDSLLRFSRVADLRAYGNSWSYRMNNMNYTLRLDSDTRQVIITALPDDAIRFDDKPGKTSLPTLPNNEHKQFHFNADHQLEYTLVRNLQDITHYDVYEYFDTLHRLMHKSTINSYASKPSLLRREAEDIEANMGDVFDSRFMKQVAPPPVEYLSDSEKMPNGKSRWAQLPDLRNASMLEPKGFILGKVGYGSLIYTGDYNGHILTMASSQSGKGVGVVIPNLLCHRGSTVVLDPKGENFIVTAQQRSRLGNRVYYFDPWNVLGNYRGVNFANTNKAYLNPLDYLNPEDDDFIMNLDGLSSSLIEQTGEQKEKFFSSGANNLLCQLITMVCEMFPQGNKARNLLTVRNLLNKDPKSLLIQAQDILTDKKRTRRPHRLLADLVAWLNTNLTTNTQAYANTYDMARQATAFLNDQNVCRAIEDSNVDLLKLKTEPITIYLILDLSPLTFNATLYKPLIRIILQCAMRGACVRQQPKEKLLFMLDEIAQLGYLDYLPRMMSIFAGMGVTVWTIWQDLAQIKKLYQDDMGTIINNCAVQQYFGVNDNDTAESVSKKAGKTTVWKKTRSSTDTQTGGTTKTQGTGNSSSQGSSYSHGTSKGFSYQGFNYTTSSGSNENTTETKTCTNSYNFSRSIQLGFSKTRGESVTQEVIPLITPEDIMTTNAYDVQIVFYLSKIPYPILSGKIKYYSDREFLNEFDDNLTR